MPPPPTTATINATLGTDNGLFATIASGGVTRDSTPTITGTVTAANLSSVSIHLFDGTTDLGAAIFNGSNWSLTTSPLADGPHIFTAIVTDDTGLTLNLGPVIGIIDTQPPTVVSVALNDVQITDADTGQSISATITFSKLMDQNVAPVVTNNAGTTLTNPSGHWQDATHFIVSYTAADANINLADVNFDVSGADDFVGNVQVAASGVSSGTAVDTANPSVGVAFGVGDAATLNDGNPQSLVTFTFSEAVVPGSVTLAVAHGSLSALIWSADNTSATATFTAENSFAGTGSVQVVSFTDTTGNAGTGGSDTVSIDTANPSVTSVVFGVGDATLNDGNPQSLVTFTFSEAVVPGSVTLAVAHGSLSALIWSADNTSATATFTAENSFAGTGSVQVVSFTDTTGNAGTGGSDTVSIDTANPSVTSVVFGVGDATLNDGNPQSLVTFTFSEAVVPGSVTLAVAHGSLSALIWSADNTSATATFTAENSFAGTGSVQVVSFTDTTGNAGTGGSDTVSIDTANPSVTSVVFGVGDATLNDGNPQSLVTFTFSEAVVPGSVTLAVAHGSLSALIWSADNTSATATFTAENSFAGTGSVQVVSFTDTTGNAGTGGSDTVSIDTANPTRHQVVFGVRCLAQ